MVVIWVVLEVEVVVGVVGEVVEVIVVVVGVWISSGHP